MNRIGRFAWTLMLLAWISGCDKTKESKSALSKDDSVPAKADRSMPEHILVVTLDTTRADRIGCYGWASARTPRLDALAAGGVRFAEAFASAPLTLPSHASLFTGVHPPVHGCRVNAAESLGTAIPVMSDVMKSRGYSTAAFVSAFVLHKRFGLDRGFDVYDDRLNTGAEAEATSHGERRGDLTCDAALAWLSRHANERVFLWVHLFDPHTPYAAPAPYGDDEAPYDGEIAFADAQVARLLNWFEESGKFENTLVVVAGDHGESLGEHGEPTHGVLLHDSTLRVPLILHWPRALPPEKVVEANVELVDVLPTVLEAVGAPLPQGLSGRSLKPLWEGRADAERLVYSETEYPWRSYG
ncbi:MAG: sulfatase [Planctomycetes bacterium]|nr:sulfatase [Planctomycetota bacterium]